MCIRDRLGPLLFSVYVNDAPREPGVQMALFADDTAVYTADRNADRAIIRLQRALDAYTTWTEIWKVAVNETKSSAVLFSVSYTHLDVYKRQAITFLNISHIKMVISKVFRIEYSGTPAFDAYFLKMYERKHIKLRGKC